MTRKEELEKTIDFDDAINRIVRLEKENAELKTKKIPQLERRIASVRGAHSVDCKKLNARTEQVERLKKENTELRKIAGFQQSSNMDRGFQLQRSQEKLNKAKEIINNCVHELQNILLHKIRNKERIASILDKAERFLKEVSE